MDPLLARAASHFAFANTPRFRVGKNPVSHQRHPAAWSAPPELGLPTANGYVIYSGPSRFGGAPVVVVVTGFLYPSDNRKTGESLLQSWILLRDVNPQEAIETAADDAICGDCVHRGEIVKGKLKGRTCYVLVSFAPLAVWKTYKAGGYPVVSPEQLGPLMASIGRHQVGLRIGSYGDPVAVPSEVWETALGIGRRATSAPTHTTDEGGFYDVSGGTLPYFTGYTHHWNLREAQRYKPYLMASVDTPAEQARAAKAGWRTFRVSKETEPRVAGAEIWCPASSEGGYKATCDACRLCMGACKPAQSIVIKPHGQGMRIIEERGRAPNPGDDDVTSLERRVRADPTDLNAVEALFFALLRREGPSRKLWPLMRYVADASAYWGWGGVGGHAALVSEATLARMSQDELDAWGAEYDRRLEEVQTQCADADERWTRMARAYDEAFGRHRNPPTIAFHEECTGSHHGQVDLRLYAYDPNTPEHVVLGHADYNLFEGEIYLSWIEAKTQRQGVGRAIVLEIQRLHEGKPFHWGMTTPDGTALRRSLGQENPPHGLDVHPRRTRPVARRTVERELRALNRQAGLPAPTIYWPRSLSVRHQETPRSYAQVLPTVPAVYELAEQTRWLGPAYRRGLFGHEVGHVLAPGSEQDADDAARAKLGIDIQYDPSWGGRGLEVAVNPLTAAETRALAETGQRYVRAAHVSKPPRHWLYSGMAIGMAAAAEATGPMVPVSEIRALRRDGAIEAARGWKNPPKCSKCGRRLYKGEIGRCSHCKAFCATKGCSAAPTQLDPWSGAGVCESCYQDLVNLPRHRACGFCGSQHCDCGWNDWWGTRKNPLDPERRALERAAAAGDEKAVVKLAVADERLDGLAMLFETWVRTRLEAARDRDEPRYAANVSRRHVVESVMRALRGDTVEIGRHHTKGSRVFVPRHGFLFGVEILVIAREDARIGVHIGHAGPGDTGFWDLLQASPTIMAGWDEQGWKRDDTYYVHVEIAERWVRLVLAGLMGRQA